MLMLLRNYRLLKQWTQKQAAEALRMPLKTWIKHERGERRLSLELTDRVAAVFQIPYWRLFQKPRVSVVWVSDENGTVSMLPRDRRVWVEALDVRVSQIVIRAEKAPITGGRFY